MGTGTRVLAVLAAAAIGAPAPPRVAAQELPDALFADPAADPAALAASLTKLGPSIFASKDTLLSPAVSTWTTGDENDRRLFGARTTVLQTRIREAMESLGFKPPETGRLRLAVRVVCPLPDAACVVSTDGTAVLLRVPPEEPAAARPVAPERWDGPPLLRDVLQGAEQGRRWLRRERVASRDSGPGSLSLALARSLVAALDLPAGVPPWVREGLASWADQRAQNEGAPAPHAPGVLVGPEGAGIWKTAFLPDGTVAPAAVSALGRAMDALVQGRNDLPARLARLAAGAAPSSEEVFGADPAQAAVAAASRLQPKEGGCRADGTISCPLCRGSGRHAIDCVTCEGTGAVPCPSCGGAEMCPAPGCYSGLFLVDDNSGYDCKLCNGDGWVYCRACKDPAYKCVVCRGSPGKLTVPCTLCDRGRLPCPDCPRVEGPCRFCSAKGTLPCGLCADGRTTWACRDCGGPGYLGCRLCFGYGRYSTTGNAYAWCDKCTDGKNPCTNCRGKGVEKLVPERCPLHPKGPPQRPCPACAPAAPAAPAAEAAPLDTKKVLDAAISFFMGSTDRDGAFGYRWHGTAEAAGTLSKHNLFSNATGVWTMLVAGRTLDDNRMASAWKVLRVEAETAADRRDTEAGTQEAAFALRALLVGGEDPKAKTVQGLVARLVKSQRPDGLWADDIKTTEVRGEVLNSLIVVEALRVAKDRGISVPGETWSRAHAAAQKLFSSRKVKAKKGDMLSGTDVACCVSLIVLTKAGSLGDKAATFDYRSMPDVKAGLGWLDRHFDATGKPTYINGARVRRRNLEGYYAYMYSMQRLAMLLGLSEFNGSRWYADGAAHLARVQRKDGSFEEVGYGGLNYSMVSTHSAILFLVRATTPITESSSR